MSGEPLGEPPMPTVPQTAVIPIVTRYYSSVLLNFATHSPEDSQANATESTVLRLQQTGPKELFQYRSAACAAAKAVIAL